MRKLMERMVLGVGVASLAGVWLSAFFVRAMAG